MATIQLGGDSLHSLRLVVDGRAHPEAADYWDGNWLTSTAEVSTGSFRGSLGGIIRSDELADFLRQIEALYQRLDGEAVFRTMEGWISFRLTTNRQGQVEVRGRLVDELVNGNALEFALFFDQTFLPPTIAQLREATKQFPVIGDGPCSV